MTNALISIVGAGVIAIGGWAAASSLDGSEPARTVSIPGATTDDTTTGTTTGRTATTTVGDISGPCDEAEHANDPRCTGGATTTNDDDRHDDDRSGPNRGPDGDDDGNEDDDDEDRSGSNSGSG